MSKTQNIKIYPYGQSHKIPYQTEEISILNSFDDNGNPIKETFTNVRFESLPASTLIQFSGGVDSTYVLYNWLIENPNDYCVVHHIAFNYNNDEDKRTEKQLESVDNILRWLDSQGLDNYYYLQNEFDYGNFNSVIYDVEVCGFLAGVILRSPRWAEIENLILPIYNNTTDRELRRRTVCETTAEKSLRFEYPLFQKNKKDIINSLPEDLLKYCWYCRSPEDGLPCGKCHSCKDMI